MLINMVHIYVSPFNKTKQDEDVHGHSIICVCWIADLNQIELD